MTSASIAKYFLASFVLVSSALGVGAASAQSVTLKPLAAPPVIRPLSPGVPSSGCRAGFVQQGYWLCMTGYRGVAQYDNAALYCEDVGGRVADVNDWRYIYQGNVFPHPAVSPGRGSNALFDNSSNRGDPDGGLRIHSRTSRAI